MSGVSGMNISTATQRRRVYARDSQPPHRSDCIPSPDRLSENHDTTRDRLCFGTSGADARELRWFVIQTHPQAERLAARELADIGYTAFLPMVSVRRTDPVVRTMSHIVTTPLFVGYLFIQGDPDSKVWRPARYCPGVKRLFSTPDLRPIPVERGKVEKIQAEADDRMIVRGLPGIVAGSELLVTHGPFANLDGICLWSDDMRVKVLVAIFGRDTEVMMARASVEVR